MAQNLPELMDTSLQITSAEGDSGPRGQETGSAPQSQETDPAPPVNTIEANMKNLKSQLIELLEPDFGLLDILIKSRTLTKVEEAKVMKGETIYDRNERLLDLIFQKGKYDDLMAAMTETNQVHLVNFVKENGVYREQNLDWPFLDREKNILNDNQYALLDILDTSLLVVELVSAGVFSKRQRGFILSKNADHKKNQAFLDLFGRCSIAAFYKTIECLRLTKQEHVAEILESGGITIPVSATLTDGNLNSVEDQLVNNITSALLQSNQSLNEDDRLLVAVKMRLIAARRGNSVVLYILCKTIDELTYLHEMMEDGRLKVIFEKLFNQLLQNMKTSILLLKYSVENAFEKAKKYLERESSRDKKLDKEILTLFEQGKYHLHVEEDEAIRDDVFAVDILMEQQQWAEDIVTDMKKLGGQPLKEYSETGKICASMRSNSDYLNEYINPTSAFISRLHASGCLTDDQMRHIKALSDRSEKNDEISTSVPEKKYNDYIRCLRETGQNIVADVVEKGGVVLRLGAEFQDKPIPSIEKQIVERINMLQDKSQVLNEELKRMLSLLKIGSTEILNAKHEMGITVWLWCQSQGAFDRITEMNTVGTLNELLLWLFNKLLNYETPQLPEIDVDIEDTEMEFVCRSLPGANIRTTLPSSEMGTICGVTKLQGHIYVLYHTPSSIQVFDDLDFSKSSKTITLNGIEPGDIAACSSTGSLYISDSDTFSVWKVTIMDNKVTKWLENVGNPFTLSVTRNGEVVIVIREKTCLEIYDADAKKLYDIKLSPGILPNHAVKTSSGNFLITYVEENEFSSICEITRQGTVVNRGYFRYETFTGLPRTISDYLIPKERIHQRACLHHMTLDEHDGVYAADILNGRVLHFDSQLALRQIIERLADGEMSGLCMTQDAKLLMVVHGEPTQLDVYELVIGEENF